MTEAKKRVALVTGCSTGIGRALADELRARGYRTFATARRDESLAELEAAGHDVVRIDVDDPAAIAEGVARVVERGGPVDVLVNNAGFNVFGPLAEVPLEQFESIFRTNVTGILAMVQAVFPAMASRGSGHIVNVGSVVGILPTPFAGSYCASKAAVHMLSDVLRMELAPFGIDVTVVQPGGVRSHIAETGSKGLERYGEPSSKYQAAYDGILRRASASQDDPMDTAEFAKGVVEQITATPRPRVVRLGTGADVLPQLATLPGERLDEMMRARYDLDKIGR